MGDFDKVENAQSGHINDTFVLYYTQKDGSHKRYILQYINSNVFKHPEQVMENIQAVTAHVRKKVLANGGDIHRESLSLVPTKGGASYYCTDQGEFWRAYDYIEGARTYEQVENPNHFYHAGRAFGKFQALLSDFPAESLHETIKHFHDTRQRFHYFLEVVKQDPFGRVKDIRGEIDFVLARNKDMGVLVDLLEQEKIPLRVIHNDTKLNNIMIDQQTGEGICVLDLDTVMPGTVLYDYGDAIRFGASTAVEDEPNLDLVAVDLELFTAYTEGYLSVAQDFLVPTELDYLAFSAKLITLELGMRFLTDHILGDTYFKIQHPNHNLQRARTQFKLVADMEAKMPEMQAIIMNTLKENKRKDVV